MLCVSMVTPCCEDAVEIEISLALKRAISCQWKKPYSCISSATFRLRSSDMGCTCMQSEFSVESLKFAIANEAIERVFSYHISLQLS